jgi:L-aminopeptidase/D-esterase-like protein
MTIREKIAMSPEEKKRLIGKILKGGAVGGGAGALLSGGAAGLGARALVGKGWGATGKGALVGALLGGSYGAGSELLREKKEAKSEKKASFIEKHEIITKVAAEAGLSFDEYVYKLGLATAEKFIDDAK